MNPVFLTNSDLASPNKHDTSFSSMFFSIITVIIFTGAEYPDRSTFSNNR